MSVVLVVILTLLVSLALYGIVLYNNLVNIKHNVSRAWANIEVC